MRDFLLTPNSQEGSTAEGHIESDLYCSVDVSLCSEIGSQSARPVPLAFPDKNNTRCDATISTGTIVYFLCSNTVSRTEDGWRTSVLRGSAASRRRMITRSRHKRFSRIKRCRTVGVDFDMVGLFL